MVVKLKEPMIHHQTALVPVPDVTRPVTPQDFLASLDFQIARLQRVRQAVSEIA